MTDHAELIERLRNSWYRFATETQDEAATRRNKAATDAATAIAALVAERDRYKDALAFYADKNNHKMRREPSYRDRFSQNMKPGKPKLGRVSEDKGKRARAALAQGGEKP
jgi:hypothetical protein